MKRGWNLPSMCVQCRKEGETIKHLFTECTFTMIIYEAVTRPMGLTIGNWRVIFKEMEVPNWIVSKKSRIKKREIPLNILFVCWRETCSRIFRDETKRVERLVEKVQD